MKYKLNERVKLNMPYNNASGTIPKGTKGVVKVLLPLIFSYKVDFYNDQQNVTVVESCLDKDTSEEFVE